MLKHYSGRNQHNEVTRIAQSSNPPKLIHTLLAASTLSLVLSTQATAWSWEAKTYEVKDNRFTNSSYSGSGSEFSGNGSCSGSSDCTISGSYTSEFLSQKTHGNPNPTNLTITSKGTLASLNISQSLNTITNAGTILGSIKDCFDNKGNLKWGVCSVGDWYGQPIIYANSKSNLFNL